MKKLFCALAAFACAVSVHGQTTRELLTEHVYTLAADSLEGRQSGTEGGRKAAEYVAARFAEAGLAALDSAGYLRPFTTRSRPCYNVVGVLRGSDSALRDEWIVLGAHLDHLGKNEKGDIFNGADDNASGTAVMIETARNLVARRGELRRSVLFVAFDAEEAGLVGSDFFVKNMPVGEVKLMENLDMVGWLREGKKLRIAGVAMLDDGKALFGAANAAAGIPLELKKFDTMIMSGSDHEPFALMGIPAMHITTGTESPYHKPEDTAEKIDYEGLTAITAYMTDVTASAATVERLESSGRRSFKHGREPMFTAGVTASAGSNYHRYRDGALDGKNAFAWNGGLYAQLNFGNWALRPKVMYEQRGAKVPLDFNERTSTLMRTGGLHVPLDVVYKFRGTGSGYNPQGGFIYIFGGGYYSRALSGKVGGEKMDFAAAGAPGRDEWGLQWGIGVNVYKLWLESNVRYGLSGVFPEGGKIGNRSSYFSVGYRF
jgi:hypothetical protein